jgi:moderate conductance mechanosensitive channel
MNLNDILVNIKFWFFSHGIKVILIAATILILIRVVRGMSRRLASLFLKIKHDEEAKKRADTVESVFRNILSVLVAVLGLMMILSELGVEIGPLLAAAGVAGLALGFAGQSLIKDIINGFFMLLEDQLRVGDYVTVAGISGQVERINLKLTVLRDWEGNMHFIPNSQIETVTNKTREFSRIILDIGVAYRENVDEVMEIIREVDKGLRKDPVTRGAFIDPVEVMGLERFDDSAVVVRARLTTRPGLQWKARREFNRRLKMVFDQRDIEIPFPHRTVYMGHEKDGSAAPLFVARTDTDHKES